MEIRHLLHSEIDKTKWDNSLRSAHNQLIYAYSWYLDFSSPNWEALVAGDYQYIMPLPIKRKYKISYLVQPALSQQLGIFSANSITDEIICNFIQKIPYRSYELHLNETNHYEKSVSRPNFILNLQKPYSEIIKKYSKNALRNIEKAKKHCLRIEENLSFDDFYPFFVGAEKDFPFFTKSFAHNLHHLFEKHSKVNIIGAFSEKNQIMAVVMLVSFNGRIYYLLPCSNQAGKEGSAMFMIVDFIIKSYANTPSIFDFEGSSIEGIARFYKGFGAVRKPFYVVKKLRPSIILFAKKIIAKLVQ